MTGRPDPLTPPPEYGQSQITSHDLQSGDWAARTPGPDDDTSCDVRRPVFRCSRTGVIRIWFGCPNEHLGYIDACALDKDAVLRAYRSGQVMCKRCSDAGYPGVKHGIVRTADHPADTGR